MGECREKKVPLLIVIFCSVLLMLGPGTAPLWAFGEDVLGITGARLTERELDEIRGGYSPGFSFGVQFSGSYGIDGSDQSFLEGYLVYDGGTGALPSIPSGGESARMAGGGVEMTAYVGDFHDVSGAVMITNVLGNANIVTQNMVIEITYINMANPSAFSSLQNLLP